MPMMMGMVMVMINDPFRRHGRKDLWKISVASVSEDSARVGVLFVCLSNYGLIIYPTQSSFIQNCFLDPNLIRSPHLSLSNPKANTLTSMQRGAPVLP